ncbi:zinc-dependent alcohol dehydrogenase family protein [Solimonas soli]|uniref:zinc-dependent alcohol dehydrogenase family protein n=1 Tax=Solimonas soli TaxID=413479 RepID=UPI000484FA35
MVLEAPGTALRLRHLPLPVAGPGEILVRVNACAVCRTDLHVLDGELPGLRYPIVPGHQIVGRVLAHGAGVTRPAIGSKVGVCWLAGSCGHCEYCRHGEENLCDDARFTGWQRDGGYATHCITRAEFAYTLPEDVGDIELAPLLCGGVIGYRALRACGAARRLGLFGFGSAAHIITQVALHQQREVYAFTRPGDAAAQAFARRLGAAWAGASDQLPPQALDAAIIFASDGALLPAALRTLRKGGRLVCAAIHMSEIPHFDYARLWGERSIQSIANMTRADAVQFLALAPRIPVRVQTRVYPFTAANQALDDLRAGRFSGTAVLSMAPA